MVPGVGAAGFLFNRSPEPAELPPEAERTLGPDYAVRDYGLEAALAQFAVGP